LVYYHKKNRHGKKIVLLQKKKKRVLNRKTSANVVHQLPSEGRDFLDLREPGEEEPATRKKGKRRYNSLKTRLHFYVTNSSGTSKKYQSVQRKIHAREISGKKKTKRESQRSLFISKARIVNSYFLKRDHREEES